MKLTPKTVYIPTDVRDELPETEVLAINERDYMLVGYIRKYGNYQFICENEESKITDVAYWLKPTEAYTFTKDELVKLLRITFDAGNEKRDNNNSPTRREYIAQLLNEE